jgi:hypothetical protein
MSVLGREVLRIAATEAKKHRDINPLRGKPLNLRGKNTGGSHSNILPLF